MNNQNKLSFEERQIRRRNRKVKSLRFKQGLNELYRKRIKRLILYLFVIIVIICWKLFIYKSSDNSDVFKLLIYIVYWLFDFICLFGLILWFGKPKNFQKIEDDIKDVFDIKEPHKVPILRSIIRALDGLYSYCFYSPDFSKERYEEKRNDIEQKLGIVIHGRIVNEKDYIYFACVPKKNIKHKGELNDERI